MGKLNTQAQRIFKSEILRSAQDDRKKTQDNRKKTQGDGKKTQDDEKDNEKDKMVEPFYTEVDDDDVKREKAKARELRNSQWWKRRRSTGLCHYCGRKFKPSELTMDHLVPMGRGGKSTKGNIVPACKECNTKKKYLLPIEWEEYLKSVKEGGREEEKSPSP